MPSPNCARLSNTGALPAAVRRAGPLFAVCRSWGPSLVVWGVWAAMVLGVLVFAYRFGQPTLRGDDFYGIVPALVGEQPITLDWLWSFYGEHRLPLPRLLQLGLYRLTGFDAHAVTFFNPLALSVVAAALIWVARDLRGWTNYTDAFFPLTLLHWGQYENLVYSWQIQFITSTVIIIILLLLIARIESRPTPGIVLLIGACTLLLPLCGANGVAYVPAMVVWCSYSCITCWRLGTTADKRVAVFLGTIAVFGIVVFGLYWHGYATAGEISRSASARDLALASGKLLSTATGPVMGSLWKAYALGQLLLLSASIALGVSICRKQAIERIRAVGLLLLGAVLFLILAMAWGRGNRGMERIPRYATLVLPELYCVYFLWLLYGSAILSRLVQAALLVVSCVAVPLDMSVGLNEGERIRQRGHEVIRDVQNGLPSFVIAEHHAAFLFGIAHRDELNEELTERCAEQLRKLRDAGIPPFDQMQSDLDYRTLPLSVVPTEVYDVRWDTDTAYPTGSNPLLVFILPNTQFVFAIRVRFAVTLPSVNVLNCGISWGTVNQHIAEAGRKNTPFENSSGNGYFRLYPRPGEQTATVWLNDTVDRFQLQPGDTTSGPFRISRIELLLPRSAAN